MFGKKRAVQVMRGKKFIAAYSTHPFVEEREDAKYPDYAFERIGKMHWCIRVGDIEVPWGFGCDSGIGFFANGVITLNRRNVTADTLDGRGHSYVCDGEVNYLYEQQITDDGTLTGFVPYMRDRLLPILREMARGKSTEEFSLEIESIASRDDVVAILHESRVGFKGIRIYGIGVPTDD